MKLTGPRQTIKRAKSLRASMSLPELLLWQAIRGNQLGLRFRRQHPAGPYILDFYCDAGRRCVEIDGEAHDRGDNPACDARRDRWLTAQGVRTYRALAREVLEDVEAVCRGIRRLLTPPPSVLRTDTSPDGGGFLYILSRRAGIAQRPTGASATPVIVRIHTALSSGVASAQV